MRSEAELDIYEYVPFYLRSIANRLKVLDTRLFVRPLDVGLNEWACLALLAREDDISATRISEVSGYDKAVISRSIRSLIDKGLVRAKSVASHNRKQLLRLTDAGWDRYRSVESRVLARENLLLQDFSEGERQQLLQLLARVLESADALLEDEQLQLTVLDQGN